MVVGAGILYTLYSLLVEGFRTSQVLFRHFVNIFLAATRPVQPAALLFSSLIFGVEADLDTVKLLQAVSCDPLIMQLS